MDRAQATKLVADTFKQRFDDGRFLHFIRNLLNHLDESKKQTWTFRKAAFEDYVNHFTRLGTYADPRGERVDVLVIHLRKETTLARGRVTLRNFVADYLATGHGQGKAAVVAAFVSPNEDDWRFSFVKLDFTMEKTELGIVTERALLTPARRYSYLVGKNENCHTAQKQFLELLQTDTADPTIAQLETAFKVEKVTKEFFEHYRELFEKTRDELNIFLEDQPAIAEDFKKRGIDNDDFAKKLLGQIVFLYFLQKKGWFGVARGQAWGKGRRDFIRHLFDSRADFARATGKRRAPNFFNDILEPLFYEALAAPRLDDDHYYSRFDCRIPFLNGGLFEPLYGYNWVETEILLPDTLFSNDETSDEGDPGTGILDVFDRYNFTVNEAEPLEVEVAVDPEMLGKVFENLLPENIRHRSGTYYTPRVIVHYMCQQALLHYISARTSNIPHDDLSLFLRLAERFADFEAKETKAHADKRLPESISQNAALIDQLLATITVCDPAIGSGAFPVGMMHEIIRARMALTPALEKSTTQGDVSERTAYALKRHAIHHSLYGVDFDPGAVEIAKLRLWLSMVVDEDEIHEIQPLPNLDYKIMQGNSLLEEFEGVRLFDERVLDQTEDPTVNPRIAELEERQRRVAREINRLAAANQLSHTMARNLKDEAARLTKEINTLKNPSSKQRGDHPELSLGPREILKRIQQLQDEFFDTNSRTEKKCIRDELNSLEWEFMRATLREQGHEEALGELERASAKHRKPFFLWRVHFADVFQKRGGFDIVIANPPYVSRHSLKKADAKTFKALREHFVTAQGKDFDLFGCFIEKGVELLREQGALAFIVASGWYTGAGFGALRRYVATNTDPLIMVNLPYDMFEAAWVDTTVLVCSRRQTATAWPRREPSRSQLKNFEKRDDLLTVEDFKKGTTEVDISKWFTNEVDLFFTRSDTPALKLLKELESNARRLGNLADIQRGVTPFHLTPEPNHPASREAFDGTVRRYKLDRGPKCYIRFDDSLAEYKPEKYFVGPRILLRELISRQFQLQAVLAEENFVTNKSMQSILRIPGGPPLRFLLAVLNSNTSSWVFLQRSNVGHRDDFPKIVLKETRDLPVPSASDEQEAILSRLVDYLLWLHSEVLLSNELAASTNATLIAGYFDQWINALVYELYLPNQLHGAGLYFFRLAEQAQLPALSAHKGNELAELQKLFEKLYRPDHPLRQGLFALDSIEEIRIIEGKA